MKLAMAKPRAAKGSSISMVMPSALSCSENRQQHTPAISQMMPIAAAIITPPMDSAMTSSTMIPAITMVTTLRLTSDGRGVVLVVVGQRLFMVNPLQPLA